MEPLMMRRPYYIITATAVVRALRARDDREAVEAARVADGRPVRDWSPMLLAAAPVLVGAMVGWLIHLVVMMCRW
jgi:hypothetical protein